MPSIRSVIRPSAAPSALIGWHEDLTELLLRELPRYGLARLLPIAAAAMDIRGYGPVKEKVITDVRARGNALLVGLANPEAKEAA